MEAALDASLGPAEGWMGAAESKFQPVESGLLLQRAYKLEEALLAKACACMHWFWMRTPVVAVFFPLPYRKVWDAEGTLLLSLYKHSGGRRECWRLITCSTPCFWFKGICLGPYKHSCLSKTLPSDKQGEGDCTPASLLKNKQQKSNREFDGNRSILPRGYRV